MSGTTPDSAGDLAAKIVERAAAGGFASDFLAPDVIVDGEQPTGGLEREGVLYVKFAYEERDDYDRDGATRAHVFQLKKRVDRSVDPRSQATKAAMVKLHDALNKLGPFTGTSGAAYVDLRARTFPRVLADDYILFDVALDFDTVSS